MQLSRKDRIRGSLLGGAIGDALGHVVEFLDYNQIRERFGKSGITEYELRGGKALVSDDTQMTLFTANGLLLGDIRMKMRGIGASYPSYVFLCYKDWLRTQDPSYHYKDDYNYSWLIDIPELHHRRAPGNTCLSALYNSDDEGGSIEVPINQSKGCGGLMRVAPVGLFCDPEKSGSGDVDEPLLLGAQIAALTHGHELGYIPAATLTAIIISIIYGKEADVPLRTIIEDSLETTRTLFPDAKHMDEYLRLVKKAIRLVPSKKSDVECINELGQGWVAEQTLAIAVFCALRYQDDFESGIIAAVNHSGDSDSTGSITGSILGARLGYGSLPQKFLENLELKDVITEIADDIATERDFDEQNPPTDPRWDKYLR